LDGLGVPEEKTRETAIAMTREGAYSNKPGDGFSHILCEF